MASLVFDKSKTVPRGHKRRSVSGNEAGRRFACDTAGCGRSFTRAEHLQRHLLNHSTGEYTCERCRAHFKRRDLLGRHMTRHKQKDEEAGAEGCGILNTRKRMWRDEAGKIVSKRPAIAVEAQNPQARPQPQYEDPLRVLADFALFESHEGGAPKSPPISLNAPQSDSSDEHDSGIALGSLATTLDPNVSTTETCSPIDRRFWSTDSPQPKPSVTARVTFDEAPFDGIFNLDTSRSFNNSFTTMNGYNWLFDMDLAQSTQANQKPAVHNLLPNFSFCNSTISQRSHDIELQLDHIGLDTSLSLGGHLGTTKRFGMLMLPVSLHETTS